MKKTIPAAFLLATLSTGAHAQVAPGDTAPQAIQAPAPTNPLLHKSQFGVGLEGLADWSRAQMFADAMKTARTFGRVDKPWENQNTVPLDPNGWPLEDAGVVVIADTPGIGGTYALSFQGKAEVAAKFGVKIENLSYDATANRSTAQIVVPADGQQLMLEFTQTNGGIRNVVLMRPGTTEKDTFSPAFIEKLKPFTTLRFMDFLATNNNPLQSWDERTTPLAASQAGARGGALEYVIALANLTGKEVWVNVPDQLDEAGVRAMAQMLKDGLKPNIKVYVEYSNEVWNWQFGQATRNLEAAKIEGRRANSPLTYDGSDNEGYWAMRRIAQKAAQTGQIFREVFGDQSFERVRPVYATQVGYEEVYKQGLSFLENRYGQPAKVIYGLASAPYFQVSNELNTKADLSVDEIFAALPADMKKNLDAAAKVQSYATYYGLKHLAYEGGQHLQDHVGAGNAEAKIAANRDPRMGALVETYLNGWQGLGGDLFVYFTLTSPYSKWGSWGLVEDVTGTSPKYNAILKVINGPTVPLQIGTAVPGEIAAGAWTALSGWDKPGGASVAIAPKKWVQYDWRVPQAGTYNLVAQVRGTQSASAQIKINNANTGTLSVDDGVEEASTAIALRAGLNVIRIVGETGRFDLQGLIVETQ